MTTGKKVQRDDWRQVLRLLRQSKQSTSQLKRSEIPGLVRMHRHTVAEIIDQAAIHWLDEVEAAERNADLVDRGR